MEHRPDTPEGVNELRKRTDERLSVLKMMTEGERIAWLRKSPTLSRDITIYPETLTPEQRERLNQIEQELLTMAYEAEEETTTKTVLKTAKRKAGS